MNTFQPFEITHKMKENLQERILSMGEVTLFKDEPLLSSAIACLGLSQEVGTINDELHRYLLSPQDGTPLDLESMRSELISWKGHIGIRIWSEGVDKIFVDHPQLLHLIHPEFSGKENNVVNQIVLFPSIMTQILSLQQVHLAVIKSWAMNTVFGGFYSKNNFYVTNEWEIRQNDGLRMAGFLSRRELAFMGTHDLTAHVAGVDGLIWNDLQVLGGEMKEIMSLGSQSSINHLLIPYIIGVLLDDLAQPIHYSCKNRLKTIQYLSRLQRWVIKRVPKKNNFIHFPKSFFRIIEESRAEAFQVVKMKKLLRFLSTELQVFAYQ